MKIILTTVLVTTFISALGADLEMQLPEPISGLPPSRALDVSGDGKFVAGRAFTDELF